MEMRKLIYIAAAHTQTLVHIATHTIIFELGRNYEYLFAWLNYKWFFFTLQNSFAHKNVAVRLQASSTSSSSSALTTRNSRKSMLPLLSESKVLQSEIAQK